jgi:hypothetical protein
MSVLWPSFLAAGMAEMVFFTLFDPDELALLWRVLPLSRTGVYSMGFMLFWLFAAISSTLTSVLQRSSEEINRCTIAPVERPPGCPRRVPR